MTSPDGLIQCPDCPALFPTRDLFVEHREKAHPPTLLSIQGAGGIRSGEAFGTDPKE